MKRIVLAILLFSNLLLHSQEKFNSENFTVTRNDLEINTYIKDSTANALVLFETGKSYVDKNDFDLKTEVKHKVKILNREGFRKANITIYLYKTKDRKETVKNIIATTYNLIDGRIVTTKLKKKNIFEEKYNENHTLIKFTLPNIKEGSVITYSYTLTSPFMFNYNGWSFQSDIPKLCSEYNASIPGNWEYNIKLVGGKKLHTNTSKVRKNCLEASNGGSANCADYLYVMKDIPAFIEEDYMTSKSNYLARIEYELKIFRGFNGSIKNYTKSWKTVDREFKTDGDIGRQLVKSINLDDHVSDEIINETDSLKKADAIYKYIQNTYTWNGDYKIFKDVSVKNLIKNKSGNISSINILLHNFLKEAGINVKPVLVSTRNNGFPTKIYPAISDFNYLIVQATINDKTYLLDATDRYLSFGELPFRCLNHYGRLLDFKKGSEWIDIEPNKSSITQYKAELHINDDNIITGKTNSRTTGYHALRKKKSYYENSNAYLKNLQDKQPHLEIFDHEVLSEGETSAEFKEAYNVEFEDDLAEDRIYLNPFLTTFFKENPFKLQERTYPIDFGYKDAYFYIFKLDLSDDYAISEKPKDVNIALPNNKGNLIFSSSIKGNTISILFKLSFKDALYAPEYYPYLKEFMNKVVDVQTNSLLILTKK